MALPALQPQSASDRRLTLCLAIPASVRAQVRAALRPRRHTAAASSSPSSPSAAPPATTARSVQRPGGRLQLSLDSPSEAAATLYISLEQGPVRLLTDEARRWVQRHGVWLINVRPPPDEPAPPRQLHARTPWRQAARRIVAGCLEPALAHAAALTSPGDPATAPPDPDGEHLHQLRVQLRRLRSALRLIALATTDAAPATAPLSALMQPAAALFGALGAARDLDVLQAALLPELRAAGAPPLPSPPATQAATPAETLRQPASTALWLDLLDWLHAPHGDDPSGPSCAAAWLLPALQRWHRQARRDAKRFAQLDETRRHTLRKRLKRLRYATEFAADLLGRRRTRDFLRALARAQTALGDYNDLCTARDLYGHLVGQDPAAWFAVGWLSARLTPSTERCTVELRRLARQAPPWSHGDR